MVFGSTDHRVQLSGLSSGYLVEVHSTPPQRLGKIVRVLKDVD